MNKKQKQMNTPTDEDFQDWYKYLSDKKKSIENCLVVKYRFDYDRNILINESHIANTRKYYGKTYKVIHANIFQRIYVKLFSHDVLAIYWYDDLAIIKIIGNKAYIIKK